MAVEQRRFRATCEQRGDRGSARCRRVVVGQRREVNFAIVNEEEEEDEANVSKDGGLNLQDLPNCVQLAAKELSVFAKALAIDPGMAYRPGSSKTREVIPGETTMRAIGSHRVGAAEIISHDVTVGMFGN